MKDVKNILADNLIRLRTQNKLTQGQLAEKLNYTDKSVSKWEHGDAIPPIDVLKSLADLYGVTLDFLITEYDEGSYDKVYNNKSNSGNKLIITLLAVSMVWFLAVIIFLYGSYIGNNVSWRAFINAVPFSCIVLLIFNGMWGKRRYIFYIVSALIWSSLTAIYIRTLQYNIWSIFILGVPLQISTILWSKLKPKDTSRRK